MLQQDLQQSMANLNTQMTQLLQAIQPLLAGADAASSFAAAAPQPVAFALSPGTTNPDQLIDFSTRTGQTLYDTGRAKLMDDESEKFDLKVTQVVRFHEMLRSRSEVMGLTNPSPGITIYQVNGRICDLISEYGRIPYDAIKTHSEVYWKYGGAKTIQRAAQKMK